MLEQLSGFIIQFIHHASYLGIFVLMFLGSSVVPFPSEIVMPFSGFLVGQGVLAYFLVVLAGTIGDVLGSCVMYGIGYFLEEAVIVRLIKKFGKFVLITEHDFNKAKHWFEKYGDKVVFLGKILPGLRLIISLPAGIFEMNFKKYLLYNTIGSLIWSLALTAFGMYLGKNWNTLGGYFKKFEYIVVVLLVLLVIVYVDHKLHLRKKFFGRTAKK